MALLICWNEGQFTELLNEPDFQFITNIESLRFALTDSKKGFHKTKRGRGRPQKVILEKEKETPLHIEAIIILCELLWNQNTLRDTKEIPRYSDMFGISLAKWLRNEYNLKLPIIFTSFLPFNYFAAFEKYRIVGFSGHQFVQLPCTKLMFRDAYSKLHSYYKDAQIDFELLTVEIEDIKSHACNQVGTLQEIKHSASRYLNEENQGLYLELYKKRISSIFEDNYININSIITFKDLLINIDQLISELTYDELIAIKTNKESNIRLLLLDDEIFSDNRYTKFIEMLEKAGITVVKTESSLDALRLVREDSENHYHVIISDYRLFEKDKFTHQPIQGYRFLYECSKLNRYYKYVGFSALDRHFLLKSNHLLGINIAVFYKNGVLANEYSTMDFVNQILSWGKEIQVDISIQIPNEIFQRFYFFYRNGKTPNLETEINLVASQYSLNLPQNFACGYDQQFHCKDCLLIEHKSNYPEIENVQSEFRLRQGHRQRSISNKTDYNDFIIKLKARRSFLYIYFQLNRVKCQMSYKLATQLIRYGRFQFYVTARSAEVNTRGDFPAAKALWITKNNPTILPEEKAYLISKNLL